MVSSKCFLLNLLLTKNQSIKSIGGAFFSTNSLKLNVKSKLEASSSSVVNKIPLADNLNVKKPSDYAIFKKPGSLYDPPYINKDPPFPNYDILNLNFYSYDYISLDTFYKYVESLCRSLEISVKEAYAAPARSYVIKSYKPYSTTLDKEYKLIKYHRVVCVEGLTSTLAPILYEAIQMNLPEGVQLNVKVPTVEEDEFRYIPDIEIQELKKSLDDVSNKK